MSSAGGKGGEEWCGIKVEGRRKGGGLGVAHPDLLLYYGSLYKPHNLPGLVHIVTHSHKVRRWKSGRKYLPLQMKTFLS